MNSRAPTRYARREADRRATEPPAPQRAGAPEPTPPDACPSHYPLAPCLGGIPGAILALRPLREDRCADSGREWGEVAEVCQWPDGGGLAWGLMPIIPLPEIAARCEGAP